MELNQDIYAEKALSLIEEGVSLFITGKAGTGKTTLLRKAVEKIKSHNKKVVVLSPTGVAARNAEGVTIHSFLHLPLGPYVSGMKKQKLYNLDANEIELVNLVDIIIIDEISMVRCDLLDEVDDVLKHYRNCKKPFGGIQMIFIGDLYQLMPVAEEEEWDKLKDYYPSPYFFSSKVYAKMACPLFELKKVHRQQNQDFVELLNRVRRGVVYPSDLSMLMSRFSKNAVQENDTIRLTTHNKRAKRYNNEKLEELMSEEMEFKATTKGWFPLEEFPTDYYLRIKTGARVMFVRNDNKSKQYINGTLGTVIGFGIDMIIVKIDNGNTVYVEKQKWDKYNYRINRKTKEIETELCGSFIQYPLKLAWAITIHKSQGLTFDKVIIDAGKAFTYGQVYVALSRCRYFKGITLVSPIKEEIVKSDPIVKEFLKKAKQIEVDGDPNPPQKTKVGSETSLYRWIRMMVKEGLTIKQMVAQTNEIEEIIYSNLAKLIENGEADIHQYINDDIYNSIENALKDTGLDAHPKDIKSLCDGRTKFAEIRMTIAHIKHSKREDEFKKYNKKSEPQTALFEKDIVYKNSSKTFLKHQCKVVLSAAGYYLELSGKYAGNFVKLCNYPDDANMDTGGIWIKKNGIFHTIIHHRGQLADKVGEIREETNRIIFVATDEKVLNINLY